MAFHSFSVTGRIDSRLPRCRRVMPLSAGFCLSTAREMGRLNSRSRFTSTIGQIAFLHAVTQEVARLVVAHPVPVLGAFRFRLEVIKTEAVRLGFHQPVVHASAGS